MNDLVRIGDEILEGSRCYICWNYFEDPQQDNVPYSHGYPVACWACHPQCLATDKLPKAEVDTF